MPNEADKQGWMWILLVLMLALAANDGLNAIFPPPWSLCGISVALLLVAVLRRRTEKESKVEGKALRLPFMSSSLAALIMSRMSWSLARNGIMNAFLPLFLVAKAHFSIKSATLYYMAPYVIEIVARPTVGAFSDKVGKRKRVLLCEYVLCGILFFFLTFFQGKLILLITILGIGLFAGTIPVVAHTFAIEMMPDAQRERTLAFLFTANTAAATFAPLLFGFLADYFGLMRSFMTLPLLIGMSMFSLLFAKEN